MSLMKNGSVRCDWCGKLSGSRDRGEYTRPDGVSVGYIVQPEWERFPGGDPTVTNVQSDNDICEECAANRCPACGSDQIIHIRPATPGPLGWGGRCKVCEHHWSMLAPSEPLVDE